ncbi:helix-turn-helix domain-containing protein [Kaistella faecalis]|uniref:helix-turn-helix domain-containing protein n=2 Tax=Kaistella faecalis TaxID=2852098 RepID=UPI001C465E72|nr:helix-turn-helix domain-containing protein [Chryseobacterium faecale]
MNTQLDQIAAMTQDVREIKAALNFMMKSSLNQLKEEWIDGQVVMQTLHISVRTLQSLRDNGTLPFSRINGKFYYKVSDIEEMLETNYSRNKRK